MNTTLARSLSSPPTARSRAVSPVLQGAAVSPASDAPQAPEALALELPALYRPALMSMAFLWLSARMPRTQVELFRPERRLSDAEFAARNRDMAVRIIALCESRGIVSDAAVLLSRQVSAQTLRLMADPVRTEENVAALRAFAMVSHSLAAMEPAPEQEALGERYALAHRALTGAYKRMFPLLVRGYFWLFAAPKKTLHSLALRVADAQSEDELRRLEAFVRGPLGARLRELDAAGTQVIEEYADAVLRVVNDVARRHFIEIGTPRRGHPPIFGRGWD